MKKVIILVAVLVAAGAVSFAAPSLAAPPAQTLEVYVAGAAPTHVDQLEPGIGPGDWLLFRDAVLNADGEEVGTAVTRVQVIAPAEEDDLSFVLDCTIELDGGRLVFSGAEQLSRLATSTSYAVIGGTGGYARASGQVTGTPAIVGRDPATLLTFELAKK